MNYYNESGSDYEDDPRKEIAVAIIMATVLIIMIIYHFK